MQDCTPHSSAFHQCTHHGEGRPLGWRHPWFHIISYVNRSDRFEQSKKDPSVHELGNFIISEIPSLGMYTYGAVSVVAGEYGSTHRLHCRRIGKDQAEEDQG